MKIEILNTGSELLLGSTVNTHGTWMGQELAKLGLRVQRQTTVPDGVAIEEALAECISRSDVVLVTGGLGPTSDDITREAAAKALGVDMIVDEAAKRSLYEFFEKRGYEMAKANLRQAEVLVGADVIPNPNGTAPGIYSPPRLSGEANCALFLLPGPPRELYPMFHAEVTPRLKALAGVELISEVTELKFVGIGESSFHEGIDAKLAEIDGLEVGYCARLGEVDLRLIGTPDAIQQGRDIAEASFSDYLIGDDGSSLEKVVVELLTRTGKTLTTAESCTGGLIASRITDVSGASAAFTHGFVTYSNEAKQQLIGVKAETLEAYGAVSEEVAGEMAAGALQVSGADIAVSITGIAGPTGGTEEKPVGTVCFGIATSKGVETYRECHPRSRADFKDQSSQRALDLVRRALR
ncbi:competence/damage-inducible protein A [Akkermansiaceae bacterium]|nr:competence/damage-inducible protein A [Akkermansiaceae bacterium]MDA7877189.1 competence/damage-inducible protein A [Akkermansiaceae bacterium]MDB4546104.1 competence/damage-inducible protein A [Akkermansiaceae bacterium]MDB4554472.1 competence/damage-inducible protein A [Akkermansiaceae bacterium]MDB4578821.1 competence/damage-inducible protein A [Akkermansiaceae bacterium]